MSNEHKCPDCSMPMSLLKDSPNGSQWYRYECDCLDKGDGSGQYDCDGRPKDREDFHSDG